MKNITKFMAASAAGALLSLGAAQAQAAIYIAFDLGGGAVQQGPALADGAFNFVANCTTPANCGGFDGITVGGQAVSEPTLLHSFTSEFNKANLGAAEITIYVTRTGLTGPIPTKFISSFSTNNSQANPMSISMETLVSTSDALFGGTFLSGFSDASAGSASSNQVKGFGGGVGPYSVTEKYTVKAFAGSKDVTASPTVVLSGIVPEPGTWALMIVGFGGAGVMLRRRRAAFA